MARPHKIGLDYFPLDVNIDDNLELIEAEHGLPGFAIIIKLWQKIYSNGYYLEWSEDSSLLFSRKINSELILVNSVINSCFRRNIFDENLYKKYEILTSSGIQKRYLTACYQSKRKSIPFIKPYLLVNSDFTAVITELIELNNEQSTQSKVKESKEEKNPPTPKGGTPPIDYQKLISIYHEKCPNMPRVEILNEQRKKAIRARVNEHGKNKVVEMFTKAGSSKFLNGDNDKNWVATFDWLFNPKNFVKTIEGNYEKSSTGKKSLQIGQILQQDGYKPKVNF